MTTKQRSSRAHRVHLADLMDRAGVSLEDFADMYEHGATYAQLAELCGFANKDEVTIVLEDILGRRPADSDATHPYVPRPDQSHREFELLDDGTVRVTPVGMTGD